MLDLHQQQKFLEGINAPPPPSNGPLLDFKKDPYL